MSGAARKWSWLTALAVVVGAVAAPAARADDEYAPGPRTVEVGPGNFKNETTRVLVNENVTFVLKDDLEPEHSYKHSIAFSHPPNPTAPSHYELDPADPNARTFTVTFDQPGYHTYRCTLHPHRGVVKVRNPLTATTLAPAPTTTTARPAPTTTTTTARPAVTAPPSTSPRGVVSAASKATTTTKPAPLTVTPLTAPSAPPSAGTSAVTAAEAADAEAATEADEAAFDEASHQEGVGRGSDTTMLMIIAIGLAAVLLGAGGWAWYHRPSRYLSA